MNETIIKKLTSMIRNANNGRSRRTVKLIDVLFMIRWVKRMDETGTDFTWPNRRSDLDCTNVVIATKTTGEYVVAIWKSKTNSTGVIPGADTQAKIDALVSSDTIEVIPAEIAVSLKA